MTFRRPIVPCLFALVIVAGCASTQVSKRQILVKEIADVLKTRFEQESWIQ